MLALRARLRPGSLPARESPNPHSSSAHAQRHSISGACSLPSRSLVLAHPGLTWMRRRLVSCRKSSTFTAVGQDERGQGIDRRGHLFQGISGQGALLSALSRAVLAVPALGKVPSCRYLPRLLTTLTANAARDLLAVVPGGTGTIGAAAEVIEAVMRGALAATGGVERAFADGWQNHSR